MLKDKKKDKESLNLESIQKYLTYILLFFLPLAIIPFPWDWTEKSMSLFILIIATLVAGIEIIKLIWNGKFTLLKSTMDIGILTILGSLTISTVFSTDLYSSLWGVDGRLGGGLIVFVAVLLITFLSRGYLKKWKDIKFAIFALLIGFGINNLLSIISFFGINVWGFIPVFQDLGQSGLPLLRSAKVHVLMNFVSIIVLSGVYIYELFNKKKNTLTLTASGILVILSILNIVLYSINQGFGIVIAFVLLFAIFMWLLFKKLKASKEQRKNIFTILGILIILISVPTALLQIESFSSVIIPPNLELVTQLSLGVDVSWVVSASVFVNSLWRGLIGLGVDTYSVAFNEFRPLTQTLLSLNDVNFYYAGNEIFTKFATGGLVWLISWIFFGYLTFKMFIKDYKEFKSYKETGKAVFLLSIDFAVIFIFISSILVAYNIFTIFVLFVLIGLGTVLRSLLKNGRGDKFVLKLWAVEMKSGENEKMGMYNINVFLTIICIASASLLLGIWGSKMYSGAYLLKAESFYIEQNEAYADINPTIEQRELFVNSMIYYYAKASDYEPNNPLINRKVGLMYLERVGIAAERYSEASDEDDTTSLLKDVGVWKNYAIDYTRKSIDTSPQIYDNWEARTQLYMGLVGLGFSDYVSDALYSLEKGIELKPLNYELYYSEAQIYVINGENDNALSSLTQVFGINPQHVPSLMLAAEINKEKGNLDVYESYLKATKKVLETASETDTEIYQTVVQLLKDLDQTTVESETNSESE